MATSANRRPPVATLIAVVLFLLSIGALGALATLRSHNATLFPPASPAAHVVAELRTPFYAVLVLWYAIAAGFAGVGIWGMHSWKASAFLIWSAAAISLGGFFIWVAPAELVMGGKLAGLLFILFVAALLALVHGYLRRQS